MSRPRTPRIVVTGATGYIGRHAVANLLNAGIDPASLILVTRSPGALAGLAQRGAQVREGEFGRPGPLQAAYAGGERLLFITPAPESFSTTAEQLAAQQAALGAARAAGIRHVVLQSRISADETAFPRDEEAYETEQTLFRSGMAWTVLRTGGFADSRGRDARRFLRERRIGTTAGRGGEARARAVTRDDIAAAAAAVLQAEGEEHLGQIYNLLGPATSVNELIELLSELGGTPVELEALDDEAYVRYLVAGGRVERIARMAVANSRQTPGRPRQLECDLPRLIGRPGQSLLDFLRAHQEELLTGVAPAGMEAVLT